MLCTITSHTLMLMYTFWKNWFIYWANAITYLKNYTKIDIRYSNMLLDNVSVTLFLNKFKNFSFSPPNQWFYKFLLSFPLVFNAICVFNLFLIVLPKGNWMRSIPFVSFPADYFPLILPSNHLATSISDYLDTICSGAIFIKFNFLLSGNFFHSIQPEPLDIYPFHQNLLIICSRLFLPFPFPLLLRC